MRPPRVLVPRNIAAPSAPKGARIVSFDGATMATTWSVKAVGPSVLDSAKLQQGIENVLERVVAQMSPWVEDSDISRYNRAPANSWCILPDDFRAVLKCALKVAQQGGVGAHRARGQPPVRCKRRQRAAGLARWRR